MILGLPPQITQMRAPISVPPSGAVPTSPQPQFIAPPAQAPAQPPLQQAQMPLQGQTPPTSPLLASMAAGTQQPPQQQQSSPTAGSSQIQQALLANALANGGTLNSPLLNSLFSPGPMSPAAQTAAVAQ